MGLLQRIVAQLIPSYPLLELPPAIYMRALWTGSCHHYCGCIHCGLRVATIYMHSFLKQAICQVTEYYMVLLHRCYLSILTAFKAKSNEGYIVKNICRPDQKIISSCFHTRLFSLTLMFVHKQASQIWICRSPSCILVGDDFDGFPSIQCSGQLMQLRICCVFIAFIAFRPISRIQYSQLFMHDVSCSCMMYIISVVLNVQGFYNSDTDLVTRLVAVIVVTDLLVTRLII